MPPPPFRPTAKRLTGWQRALVIIGGLILLFILLAGALIASRHVLLSGKINSKLAQIHAAHEPVTVVEHDSYYKALPLDTNGASLYKQAFTTIRTGGSHRFLEDAVELSKNTTNALPENLRQSMAKAVADSKSAFEPLRKAAACGPCRFPIDYTNGWSALMLHASELPLCGRLELCNGVLKEQAGDVDAAIESVDLICKYADSVSAQPDLVGVLTQYRLDYQAYDLSFWLLNHRKLSHAQLATLQKIFSNREPPHWIDRAVIGDRCATLAIFDYSPGDFLTITAPGEPTISEALALRLARFLGQAKLDELTYLGRLDDFRAAAHLPFPESLDRADILTRDIRNESRSKWLFATGSILPGMIRVINRDAQHLARMHLVQTALAIEQYRIEHRALPEELDSLKLADSTILIDPFDGTPLGYEPSENGYTLYSIGPDREDGGGLIPVPLYTKEQFPRGDFTASVAR